MKYFSPRDLVINNNTAWLDTIFLPYIVGIVKDSYCGIDKGRRTPVIRAHYDPKQKHNNHCLSTVYLIFTRFRKFVIFFEKLNFCLVGQYKTRASTLICRPLNRLLCNIKFNGMIFLCQHNDISAFNIVCNYIKRVIISY